MEIKKIDYGIAFRIGNTIYLNHHLDSYPQLKRAILRHEFEHSEGYGLRDVLVDLKGKHLSRVKKEYYRFIFKHPKSFLQMLPIMKIDDDWIYDPIAIIIWVLGLLMLFIMLGVLSTI